jgi:hypothetical protein
MRSDTEDWLKIIGGVVALVGLCALLIWVIARDVGARRECRGAGGRVVEERVYTGQSCETHHSGSRSWTDCHATYRYPWHCEYPAERR